MKKDGRTREKDTTAGFTRDGIAAATIDRKRSERGTRFVFSFSNKCLAYLTKRGVASRGPSIVTRRKRGECRRNEKARKKKEMRAQSVDAVGRRVNDLSLSLPLPSSRERDAPHPGLDLGRVTDKFSDIANDSPAYLPSRRPTAYAERARETMAERRWPTANDDAFAREGGCMVRARKREKEREREKRRREKNR